MNKFGRPWVPYAIYQDSASKLSWFWRRRFLSTFTIYRHGGHLNHSNKLSISFRQKTPMWNLVKSAQAVSEKKTFKDSTILYMYIAQGQGQITPQGTKFWFELKRFTTLLYIVSFCHKSFIHFEKKIFIICMGTQIWPCHKKVKGQPKIMIWTMLVDLESPMLPRFSLKAFLVLEKKSFRCFYQIWAWRPSWLTDHDHFEQIFNPPLQKGQYEIWRKVAQGFQRSRSKVFTDGRMTASDHNSSSWPFGSGELKR